MAIIVLISLYVYFVTYWGQQYMKSRPAYDLKNIIKVYNLIQIVVNLYIGIYVSIAIIFLSIVVVRCFRVHLMRIFVFK